MCKIYLTYTPCAIFIHKTSEYSVLFANMRITKAESLLIYIRNGDAAIRRVVNGPPLESRNRQKAASIQARELQSILVRCSQRSSTELEV